MGDAASPFFPKIAECRTSEKLTRIDREKSADEHRIRNVIQIVKIKSTVKEQT